LTLRARQPFVTATHVGLTRLRSNKRYVYDPVTHQSMFAHNHMTHSPLTISVYH
jgi:hypothetical protein